MSQTTRISAYLRNAIYTIAAKEGVKCLVVKLKHMDSGGDKVASVNDFYIGDEPNIDSISNQIVEIAQADADANGGMQRYVIHAYYGMTLDKVEKQGGRCVFSVRAEKEDMDEDEFDAESKDIKGHNSQLMRHNEALMKGFIQDKENMGRLMLNMMNVLGRQNEVLMVQNNELHARIQSAEDKKVEREVLAYKTQASEKRKQIMFEKVTLLMPYIVNKMAGKSVLNESKSPEGLVMKSFIDSLQKEQIEKILETGILSQDQLTILFGMMEANLDSEPKQIETK